MQIEIFFANKLVIDLCIHKQMEKKEIYLFIYIYILL